MSPEKRSMQWLEPPDGGLERVHERIRRRHRRRAAAAGLGAVALVAGVVLGAPQFTGPPVSETLLARIEARESTPEFRIRNGSALQLDAPGTDSRIYLVSIASDPEPI